MDVSALYGCIKKNILKLVISFNPCFLLAVAAAAEITLDYEGAYNLKGYTVPQVDISNFFLASVFHLFLIATCSADLGNIMAVLDSSRQHIVLEIPAVPKPLMSDSLIEQMKQDYTEAVAEAENKNLPKPLDHCLDKLGSVFAVTRVRCTTTKNHRHTGETTSVKTKKIKISLPDGMTLKPLKTNGDDVDEKVDDDVSKALYKNITIVDEPLFQADGHPLLDEYGESVCDTVYVARWSCIVEGTEERKKIQAKKAEAHSDDLSSKLSKRMNGMKF
jgi:hypothetical protein